MVKILVPSGVLGLQFDHDALKAGIDQKPDLIAIDGGSTDSGPFYLGTGCSKYSAASTKNELKILLKAREQAKVPLVITSSGTCGTNSAVEWLLKIAKEVISTLGFKLKIATIKSSQDPQSILNAYKEGKLQALKHAPEINAEIIQNCENIVALMGVEQIQVALTTGVDLIIAGRATDTASIAALPIMNGTQEGIAWHGAKIAECGALCSSHPLSGSIMVEFFEDCFMVEPLYPEAVCTPYTVSSHMLYENSNPYMLPEPGGILDVSQAKYEAVSPRKVRVSGSQWKKSSQYTVKLEGAGIAGYQTTILTLIRNQHYVRNIHSWVKSLREFLEESIRKNYGENFLEVVLDFRVIGSDSVLGNLEKNKNTPTEVGVLCIVNAPTQSLANEIAKHANPYLLHHPLTPNEELPTFAFLYSPAETPRGPLYEFYLNHVMVISDPMEPFTLEVIKS